MTSRKWTVVMLFSKMLISIFSFCVLSPVVFGTTCYDTSGQASSLVPCNATANISSCCGGPDYCLSNGLCFDAGANNLLVVQGCTDPNWGAPCHKYCSGRFAISKIPPPPKLISPRTRFRQYSVSMLEYRELGWRFYHRVLLWSG